MATKITHYILVGNKRYAYSLLPTKDNTTIICEGAGIRAQFPNEQVPVVLAELAKAILNTRQELEAQSEVMRFRVTPTEKRMMEKRAHALGYKNMSSYLRAVALGKI
jgi:hypothetical protein